MAFVLLIEVEAAINVLFFVIFYTFSVFLRVIKGIEYHQIIITLYPPNSIIFSPYVKLNVFDHSGTSMGYDPVIRRMKSWMCVGIDSVC